MLSRKQWSKIRLHFATRPKIHFSLGPRIQVFLGIFVQQVGLYKGKVVKLFSPASSIKLVLLHVSCVVEWPPKRFE